MKYRLIEDKLLIEVDGQFNNKQVLDFFDYYKKSKKDKYLYLSEGLFLVNNKKCELSTLLKEKDVITIFRTKGRDFKEDSKNALVVYEDEFYYVVHKTSGMIIHEDDKAKLGTLNNLVSKNYLDNNLDIPVRPIHRLDADTCGMVVYSKFVFFQSYLDDLLSNKEIKRLYLAVGVGKDKVDNTYLIKNYLAKDRHVNNKYRITKANDGKETITKLKCLASNKNYSLYECELETGRTHQIRIHLASINHAIVSDKIYGKIEDKHNLALYAYKLRLINPLTNKSFWLEDNFIDICKIKGEYKL